MIWKRMGNDSTELSKVTGVQVKPTRFVIPDQI
jgi:hypothetical protein